MNAETVKWSRCYQTALRKHLAQGPGASLRPALKLGRRAAALGLETLDLAGFHEQALKPLVLPCDSSRTSQRIIKQAKTFFLEAIVPIEKTHRATLKAGIRVNQLTRTLRRRTMESSASARCLKRSIFLRQGAEQTLKNSGKRHDMLLAELHRLQKRLRDLTHTCLSVQENERQKMSFRLHDEIAQALIAIDLRLLSLKKAARAGTVRLKKEIAKTQRLVKESVRRIDRFAHEFGIQHKT